MRILPLLALSLMSMVLPAQQAPKTMHEEYYQWLDGRFRMWSLLEERWYEYSMNGSMCPGCLFDGSLVKGSRLLKPGCVEQYQVFFASSYQGRPMQRWKWWPGQERPSFNGTTYTDDEVQVAWELRASPGLKILSVPQAPRGTLRYGEPYVTTFQAALGDTKADPEPELELYVCLYRESKLVDAFFSVMVINSQTALEPDKENDYMRGIFGKVSEEIIMRHKQQSKEWHCAAPGPDEVIIDVNMPAPLRRWPQGK